jgi:hydrogenase nickel incorporation protein HypA/HybF
MQSVMETVEQTARNNGALAIDVVRLVVGDMTEVVNEAMEFAFEAMSPGTPCEGAKLEITNVRPRSRCLNCGYEYEHDRYHWGCPKCDSLATELIAGRELYIDSIEIEQPDV